MENESRNSEEQSRKLIRIKNQWFVSTESESDSDDSVMIRIRIDTCNTYSTIETWPDSWHSVSDHGHLSPAVRTSGSRNLVGLQWHSLYQHVIWWRRSLSCYRYRSEPKLPADLCPLQDFWKKNSSRFPHLAKLAKKYLAVCATSTPAERAFSKLGLLLAKRRLSLDGENVNKIIFLSDKL